MLLRVKTLSTLGYVKFLPLTPIVLFYSMFREQAGNMGVAKHSVFLLFLVEKLIKEEQNPRFYADYKDFMESNKVHWEKKEDFKNRQEISI